VIESVKVELENFASEGYRPTLRAMFYRLYSRGIIPNTPSAYDRLSKTTGEARVEGRLDMDCFIDNSRQVIEDFNETYWTPQQLIDARIGLLRRTEFDYIDYVPRWYNQPHYVEVWIEKDAMAAVFQTILKGLDVRIVPMKGNVSWTFLNECANRINHFLSLGKHVHILYYGDFDPSGDYMDTDLENRLGELGIDTAASKFYNRTNTIDLHRVAVRPEQIDEYNLPFNLDRATREKMENDSRTNGFMEKYGTLYATELHALPALIPDVFRQELVIDEVEQYFDDKIYTELVEKYKSRDIHKLLKTSLRRLAEVEYR
jgi:hypothetical protein